jgi:hypothetical protein
MVSIPIGCSVSKNSGQPADEFYRSVNKLDTPEQPQPLPLMLAFNFALSDQNLKLAA